MRRLGIIAGIISFMAGAACAQVFHGIPPSVTSFPAPSMQMGPSMAIPAGVTSQTGGFGISGGFGIRRHNFAVSGFISTNPRRVVPIFVPVFTPVIGFYPYAYYPYAPATYAQPGPAPAAVDDVEPPAPTIFEHRPGYHAPKSSTDSGTAAASAAAPSTPSSDAVTATPVQSQASAVPPEPTTILVFNDGHQVEIGNYAIVGNTLYNLSAPYIAHKIVLADLDLDATVKINEDRGYEFHLPRQQ